MLIGLLSVIHSLLIKEPSFKPLVGSKDNFAMINELYSRFLFSLPTPEESLRGTESHSTPKCKTSASRSTALTLLAELGRDCPSNLVELLALLFPHHVPSTIEERQANWENPKIFEKSSSGYVGLKNLGSICYMNSLMQQFYMMPNIRNALVSLPINENEKPPEENLMLQIQTMFSYLSNSERQYFNPSDFCRAFKDWEGQPINISLQADVLEFFNILCDHLETHLKPTTYSNLLNKSFTGTLSQEFICKDCPHYSESEEPFCAISVDIKNKKDLHEALESFVDGEILEGASAYSCEECKKKVRAIKRCSIKRISPTLIIHLKRFEYMIDRQTPIKLSDHFAFPTTLNVEPYTKEGIEKKETSGKFENPSPDFEYELVGVLVHSGHADAGHYYSFIKERSSNDPRSNRWFRFDDTQVTPFNIENLPEECFGGTQTTSYSAWSGHVSTREQPKMKNAYMLFYEKVHRDSQEMTDASQSMIKTLPLLKHIQAENYQLMRDRQLFDPEYFHFMFQLLSSVAFPPNQSYEMTPDDVGFQMIQLETFFLFETFTRVREEKSFVLWMKHLTSLFQSHVYGCKWFLELLLTSRRSWFRYLLLECYDEYVRQQFSELLIVVLKTLGPLEYEFYLATETFEAMEIEDTKMEPQEIPKAVCVRFMEHFLSMMETTRQHWRRFSQYFQLLRDYASMGPWERLFLAHKNIVAMLVDYYMGPFSPNLRPGVQRVRIGDNNSPADLHKFMQAMAICVRSQATDGYSKSGKIPENAMPGNIEYPLLQDKDKRLLFNKDFFSSLIKQGYNVKANQEIVAHCAWEDQERSQWMLEILMDLICKANWNACDNLFAAVEAMLEVRDSIESWRVEVTLNGRENGMMDVINYYRDRYPKFTQTCVKFTLRLLNRFPLVAAYLYHTRKEWWGWLEPWLKSRISHSATDGELSGLFRDLQDFVDGKLAIKGEEDFKTLWREDVERDHKKFKLFIQKF